MNRVSNGNNGLAMPPASIIDKSKDWQLEILMEKLRSKSAQYKTLPEIAKNVRMAMLDKRYALDSVEKSQHQKCLDTLQHSIKVTSLQSMVERLESLTRQLGLKFMMGPSDVEYFISSDMFYLEIVLEQTGVVKDVKVHHEGKMEQQSCSELVNCLSRGDFTDFTAQLEGFASIYQINAEKKIKCKAFNALQSLESDLTTLSQLQSFMKEPFNLLHKSPVGILEKRRGGHPMKLTYFVSPYDLINIDRCDLDAICAETVISKNLGYSVTVCMESSAVHKLQTTTLITVNRNVNGKSTPSFSSLNNQNGAPIPACFVLKLNKSMPICAKLVRQIQQLTELDLIDVSTPQPLLNLIVAHSSGNKMSSGNNRGLFVTLPDQNHCYFMTENKSMEGILINSVPFTHPAHVSQILVILRQQALFNTIIASCVRPNSKQDLENMVMLEISALSWTHLSISLEHPLEESMATAEIDLSDISNLNCKICAPGAPPPTNSPDATSELATKILNRSFSLPVTMRAVLKLWEKQSMRRNHFNGHENFSLPLGPGDPGGRKGGNNGGDYGTSEGIAKIKQEPPNNGSQMIQGHHHGMFLNDSLTFHNFQSNDNVLSSILSNVNEKNLTKKQQLHQKSRKIEDLWRNNSTNKRKMQDEQSEYLETSSNDDSTSRSTLISQENDTNTLGFQSDLELSSLDPADLLNIDKTEFDSNMDELGDVEEMLSGSLRKSKDHFSKSPPPSILIDLGEKNLVPPSVSITPIATPSSSFLNPGGGGNAEKRPGIEIIPLANSASIPTSSITITPISNTQMMKDEKNRAEKKSTSNKSRSEDKSRLEKKRKRKRDESPMGPPEKVPPKQDPLNKPVSVSIKPAESPPLSISTPSSPSMVRKFNASPTPHPGSASTNRTSLSGKLSPNLMKSSIIKSNTSAHAHSPKHSPAHLSSPKHIPGISSPKNHGTSPKHHPSNAGSGKPSMSTLKSAANSPSSKSGDSSKNKSKESSTRDKDKKNLLTSSSGGSSSTLNSSSGFGGNSIGSSSKSSSNKSVTSSTTSSSISSSSTSLKVKPLDLNVLQSDGGVALDNMPSPSGSGADINKMNPNQARNRKGSLSAIVDKLKSAQCDGVTDLSTAPKSSSNSARDRLGPSTKSADASGKITTKNSEYMVKPSSDGIKLTINKTRTKDINKSNLMGKSSGTGTGSPKSHTGLKPGVNSGPASKKPQHLSTQKGNVNNNATPSSGGYNKKPTPKLASSNKLSSKLGSGNSSLPKTATDLSRNKPKLNKSGSDKSIFGKDRKSSPTNSNRDDDVFSGSKLATPKLDPYASPLMMEGLMKQLDKNFQIPKLSARGSGGDDKKQSVNKMAATTNDNVNNVSASSINRNTVDTKIFDLMIKSDLSKCPVSSINQSNKIFDSALDSNKMRMNNATISLAPSMSSPKIKDGDDIDSDKKRIENPAQNLSGDDLSGFKLTYNATAKPFVSDALSLSNRSIDLSSKFIAPAPKDDKKENKMAKSASGDDGLLDFSTASTGGVAKDKAGTPLVFPQSPSVSVHIVKSPAPSPLVNSSPHSASPCITDDELMDEALIGMGK